MQQVFYRLLLAKSEELQSMKVQPAQYHIIEPQIKPDLRMSRTGSGTIVIQNNQEVGKKLDIKA